ETLEGACALHDFEAAAGDADRSATEADGVVGLDQHARNAVAREAERRGEANRAAADDHDRVALRFDAIPQFGQPRRIPLAGERVGLECRNHRWLLFGSAAIRTFWRAPIARRRAARQHFGE